MVLPYYLCIFCAPVLYFFEKIYQHALQQFNRSARSGHTHSRRPDGQNLWPARLEPNADLSTEPVLVRAHLKSRQSEFLSKKAASQSSYQKKPPVRALIKKLPVGALKAVSRSS